MRIQRMFVTVLCVILLTGVGFSQTVVPVEAGAGPDANLTAALFYANSGDAHVVIELATDGGVYTLSDEDSVMYDLTIRAKEGLAEKPTIIPADGDTLKRFLDIMDNCTLKLQGIKFDGRWKDETLAPFNSKAFVQVAEKEEDTVVPDYRPNLIIEDCDFSNSYEYALPETDTKGGFIEVSGQATAGVLRIENCTFTNCADEVILAQKAKAYDELERQVDSLIVRNCTFIHCGHSEGNQGLVTVKGDQDSTTADAGVVVENLTVYNCGPQVAHVDDSKNAIVRNLIIASPDTTAKNSLVDLEKESSSISHICAFNVAPAMVIPDAVDTIWQFILENGFKITEGRYTGGKPGIVDTETIFNFDPMFADPENGDFTLLEGSPAYGKADDGGALGDLRWATNPTDVASEISATPDRFSLSQNYPNPFNPATTIDFSINKKSMVKLQIFDIRGSLVETLVSGQKRAGNYEITWDASNVATGTYFCRIEADGQTLTRKMVLIK